MVQALALGGHEDFHLLIIWSTLGFVGLCILVFLLTSPLAYFIFLLITTYLDIVIPYTLVVFTNISP